MSAFPPVTDYALVGDGHSAALVSSEGAIEWWCPERFDAPSVFARILDRAVGGHFLVGAARAHHRESRYLGETNVHALHLATAEGRARLLTLMPHAEAGHPRPGERRIVRVLEGVEGEVEMRVEVVPRFDYARRRPTCEASRGRVRFASAEDALVLRSTIPLEARAHDARGALRLREGERHALVLSWGDAPAQGPLAEALDALERERAFWGRWMSRCRYEGPYAGEARRSMLALKLMQHAPTGSFVAAPTLGLPEIAGLGENWDYRYCWLRDGAFIVMAFETMGFNEESLRFRRWLAEVVKRDAPERLQTLYRVDGARDVPESTLDHLEGYERSRPVFLGNKAVDQHQLDTFGETMMCFHRADELFDEQGEALWPALRALVDETCARWREPDSGIWELRDRRRHYVYSKAMAWLAIRHGLKIAEARGYEAPRGRWARAAEEVRDWVESEGYDDKRGGYRQAQGRDLPDAANLLLALLGFAPARDPRMRATVERTVATLGSHGLLHRHLQEGSQGSEGAFLPASFWLAHVLAHQGRLDEARAWFDAACGASSALGLLPEEADALTRAGRGNHPQALTHLALVLAAYGIGHPGEE